MGALREDRIGRYELLIELGRGGMAELLLGRLHGAGGFAKLVAIKRILPHLAQDAQFKELFLNEGRIAAQMSHPNVCQVFELDQSDDELFLAMEYLDGVSWEHLIATVPRGSALHLAAGVIGQAAEGLHYAHTLRDVAGKPTPVVHRDVSPQNLFVTVDGVCKVLDFGVSKIMTDGPRTRSGVLKGKLPYMAPEQIRGEDIDARTDVFALGVCAWEALTGVRLFERANDFLIWKAITEEDAAPIATHWPECPAAVEAAIRRALDRVRDNRQSTARELAEELRAGAGGAAGLAEIAHAVRTRCADRIAARAASVASAVRARHSAMPDRDAADTLDDAASMQMRRGSLAIGRPDAHAATTRDLGMAPTIPDRVVTSDRDEPVPRRRRPARGALFAALAAATLTVLVVVVMSRGGGPAEDRSIDAAIATTPDRAPYTRSGGLGDLRELGRLAELPTMQPDQAPGRYSVDSRPSATIFVDGKELGDTPLVRVPLRPGPHRIRAVLADRRERSLDIEIASGKETSSGTLSW